jgi:hypothetical protein
MEEAANRPDGRRDDHVPSHFTRLVAAVVAAATPGRHRERTVRQARLRMLGAFVLGLLVGAVVVGVIAAIAAMMR